MTASLNWKRSTSTPSTLLIIFSRQDNNRLRELFEQVSLKTVVPQVSPLVAQPPMSVEQDQNMPRMYIPNNPISDAENKQQEVTQLPTTDNLDDLATLVSDISLPDLDNALGIFSVFLW